MARYVQLVVSPIEAWEKIARVEHSTCRRGLENYWHVEPDGRIRAQPLCWLFCWAKTGQGSRKAEEQAKRAFNAILNISFEELDRCIDHEWARKVRHEPLYRDHYERQLYRALGWELP